MSPTRSLVVSVNTTLTEMPDTTLQPAGLKFTATRASGESKSGISIEGSIRFADLEVGSVWSISVQAVSTTGQVFGPAVTGSIEITPADVVPQYMAPTGSLSFLLE